MAITTKTPPIKETVGAQYICFNTPGTNGEYTNAYEPGVEKSEVVKSVKVSENTENGSVYGSGKIYTQAVLNSSVDVDVEVIAFSSETLAKMRGDSVDVGGLILTGEDIIRPYFAYGKVVKYKGGNYKYDWYPKCQLVSNSDDSKTAEDKIAEQNDTLKIKALPFDDKGHISSTVQSDYKMPAGLTEDKFFTKPILTVADLAAAIGPVPPKSAPEPKQEQSGPNGEGNK